jgi:serine protease Do
MANQKRLVTYSLVAGGVAVLGTLAIAHWSPASTLPLALQGSPSVAARPMPTDIEPGTFRQIAEDQMPMVVSIRTLSASDPGGPSADESFRRFFGLPDNPDGGVRQGVGSGFIIDRSGLVLTNRHVVSGATRIEVALFPDPDSDPDDVRRFSAKVLGRDRLTDSALLQIEAPPDLPAATFGNSDAMRPGDWVMAIGNPFALSHTVTVGVVSANARPFPVEGRPQRMLQTDAAVNPGNSGGPLLNLRGEVIGINTAILSPGGAGNIGIGFAVPINFVRDLLPRLRTGNVERGRLGIGVGDVPREAASRLGVKDGRGALVSTVDPDGPADQAGIEPGDVIVDYNGETVDDADELVGLVSNSAPGKSVPVAIMRGTRRQNLHVTIGALGNEEPAPRQGRDASPGFGLSLTAVTPQIARQLGLAAGEGGAVVASVSPGSAAAEAGLSAGDVILEVNRTPVANLDTTASRLRAVGAGEPAFVLVWREERRVFLTLMKPR